MKKISLMLIGVLTLTAVMAHISAQENSPDHVLFRDFLQGPVAQGRTRNYGEWTAIEDEVIIGTLQGDLIGSSIAFTIVSNRRYNAFEEVSFIDGNWMFVSSSEESSVIGGNFKGSGPTLTEFEGKFMTTQSQKSNGTYTKAKISGDFSCWFRFITNGPYGGYWRYEAWWNGTFREGGN